MNRILSICFTLFLFLGLQAREVRKPNIDYVNLFIGTASDRGQTDPAATVPYGMIKVGPDCIPASHVGYDYRRTLISGFSINRLGGVGCSGGGRQPDHTSGFACDRAAHCETGRGSRARILCHVARQRCACRTDSYQRGGSGAVYVFRSSRKTSIRSISTFLLRWHLFRIAITDRFLLTNWKDGFRHGIPATKVCISSISICMPPSDWIRSRNVPTVVLPGAVSTRNRRVEFRIAVSPIGTEEACKAYVRLSDSSFEDIRQEAFKLWKEKLSVVDVEGGSEDDKTMFYTSLYRCFLSPFNVTSADGYFLIHRAG